MIDKEEMRQRKFGDCDNRLMDTPAATSTVADDERILTTRRSSKIDQTFTKLIVILSLALAAVSVAIKFYPECSVALYAVKLVDILLARLGVSSRVYAVVLDAGSTGSRLLAFTFYENPVTNNLMLVDEVFKEVKPGLSSFADNPKEGAATVQALINEAYGIVPESYRKDTPVSMKATAGLRLLPHNQSEALIAATAQVLANSGFLNRNVEIMSELDEGLYGWTTVNYLLDQLHNPRKSYVALDLGGGSTQITFSPKYDETFDHTPADFLHKVSVIRKSMTVYSHSYLGLGLMAARNAVFLHSARAGDASISVSTPCVSKPTVWKYANSELQLEPIHASYESCMIKVMDVLDTLKVHQCDEIPTRKIAAFSYFYDRAVDAGILQYGESAVVQVQDFLNAAQIACTSGDDREPFLCVDLTYISGLLHHGYRFAADAKLGLYREINGHTTSWALGAAFALLEK